MVLVILAASMASLASFAMLFGVVASGILPLSNGSSLMRFAAMNALLPFALKLAICWFGARPEPRLGPLTGRLSDALSLGGAMAAAGAMMVLAGTIFGATSSADAEGGQSPILTRIAIVVGTCFLAGAVIGALVLGSVRKVALARILTPSPAQPDRPAPLSSDVERI